MLKRGSTFRLVVQMNAASSIVHAVKKLAPTAPVKSGNHFIILF